jgi:phosphate transport system permease protein
MATTSTAPPTRETADQPVRQRGDRIFAGLSKGAGILILVVLAGVAAFLFIQAIPAFVAPAAALPDGLALGAYIGPLVFGTLLSSIIALIIATPLGVAVALFITHYAPRRLAQGLSYIVDLLAAVPSIIFGLWGANTLAPASLPLSNWLNEHLGWLPFFAGPVSATGRTMLVLGLTLAVMILPIICAVSREVFLQTPKLHEEAALALGATRWEMIRMAVLPYGRAGVVSGAMLGLGRALGETVAVLLILSKVSTFSPSVLSGGETFASKIAGSSAEFGSNPGPYIAAGLVLFVLTFVVNAAARAIVNRRKDFV